MKIPHALAVAALFALPTAAGAAQPVKFLGDAIKGDNSEMTLGALAQHRGHSAATRAFGGALVRDHARAKVNAVAAAHREGVAIPGAMMPEARAEDRKLRRLSGRAFDREFARYMVDDHRKDVAEFREQARTGDRITARLARQTLPALRRHLAMAQRLRG